MDPGTNCFWGATYVARRYNHHSHQEVKMKHYRTPELVQHGDIAQLTAIFGGAYTGDVLIDENGDVVQQGNQSIDACPTPDQETCL